MGTLWGWGMTTQKRILIIDDEEVMCKEILPLLLGAVLGSVVVDGALTSEEGLQLFKAHTYDLVFVDRCLGSDDGLEIIRDMRRQGFAGKIIFMTASDKDTLRQGIEAGANAAAQKPFDLVQLRMILTQIQFLS